MPLISPEPRYFSMPSSDDGGADFRKAALNCWPCSRWTSHLPDAWTNSPAEIEAAWPSTVTRSRCPPNLDPQDAVAVVGVVVGHPFDQPGQGFAIRDGCRVGHAGKPTAEARQSGVAC